ncbi:MAG: cell division protein FtsZ, partial [Nitrospinales bacterium]
SPLLDDSTVDGARGLLINITGGEDLTLHEASEAAELIQKNAHDDAHIIFGAVIDKNLEGKMRVTVIATGYERENSQDKIAKLIAKPVSSHGEEAKASPQESASTNLRVLARSIKGDYQETSYPAAVDFDIPTFLRKHAD